MRAFFGGPRATPGYLRDLLAKRIRAVPTGGSITWVTYYFRDRRLAEDLLAAHRRGVRVTVIIENKPRTPYANDPVKKMLGGARGLGAGFRSLSISGPAPGLRLGWEPHLHEKLYCFSHPRPVALVGSYNPSGDQPEKFPEIIREIGDQERGYNHLVEISEPRLVAHLVFHARNLQQIKMSGSRIFSLYNNLKLQGENAEIFFLPSLLPHPVLRFLHSLKAESLRLKLAVSHLKGPTMARKLAKLAGKGFRIEIIADSTLRRVPAAAEKVIKASGIFFRRLGAENRLPMHDKFILVEGRKKQWVIFGSFNWTSRSWWLNQEICVISADAGLYKAFTQRWEELAAAAQGLNSGP